MGARLRGGDEQRMPSTPPALSHPHHSAGRSSRSLKSVAIVGPHRVLNFFVDEDRRGRPRQRDADIGVLGFAGAVAGGIWHGAVEFADVVTTARPALEIHPDGVLDWTYQAHERCLR